MTKIKPFKQKIWLASPTMHGEELQFMKEAYETNWMSTVGANIDEIETVAGKLLGDQYAVALASGTAALHLAIRLAGVRLFGYPATGHGALEGQRVFCSDLTFNATLNPVIYENGEPVFIDTENDTWNMDPIALERAFEVYPDVKLVISANLYGTPAKLYEIRRICDAHGALLIEDAAESLGAFFRNSDGNVRQTGTFGDYNCISFNGNKIITGSAGGMLLARDQDEIERARKWSTQAREPAPWYQHTELGYNYRMSNVIAGVVRGQWPHLREHIEQKKAIYERYREGFADLPIEMNPFPTGDVEPNYWLSCCTVNREAMCLQTRTDREAKYVLESGKSCPTEILEVISDINAEGRPIWKPMHMQPIYRGNGFVNAGDDGLDVGVDIFDRGLCLPSDNKMTAEQQNVIIEAVKECFV